MHNVSLTGCALILLYFQNRATKKLLGWNIFAHWNLYLTLPTLFFWIGFYLEAVPLDVMLWFLTIGYLNGWLMKKHLRLPSQKWLLWSTLSGLIGFTCAVLVLIPLEQYLSSLKGLAAHIVLFSLLGLLSGIPMAIIGGILLKKTTFNQDIINNF